MFFVFHSLFTLWFFSHLVPTFFILFVSFVSSLYFVCRLSSRCSCSFLFLLYAFHFVLFSFLLSFFLLFVSSSTFFHFVCLPFFLPCHCFLLSLLNDFFPSLMLYPFSLHIVHFPFTVSLFPLFCLFSFFF